MSCLRFSYRVASGRPDAALGHQTPRVRQVEQYVTLRIRSWRSPGYRLSQGGDRGSPGQRAPVLARSIGTIAGAHALKMERHRHSILEV